jgi:hypothetical protein
MSSRVEPALPSLRMMDPPMPFLLASFLRAVAIFLEANEDADASDNF